MKNQENQNKSIQKPISLILNEEKEKLYKAIKEVNLHPALLEMILKEAYLEIHNQADLIAEKEKNEYEIVSKNTK